MSINGARRRFALIAVTASATIYASGCSVSGHVGGMKPIGDPVEFSIGTVTVAHTQVEKSITDTFAA